LVNLIIKMLKKAKLDKQQKILLSLRFIFRHTVLKYMCYESPKKEKVSHAFEHLIQNPKAYNGVRI